MVTENHCKAATIQISWKIHHKPLGLQCTGSPQLQRVTLLNLDFKKRQAYKMAWICGLLVLTARIWKVPTTSGKPPKYCNTYHPSVST